jgi:PGM1 C-terminal domain
VSNYSRDDAAQAVLAIQSREPHVSIMSLYPGAEFLPERPVSAVLVRAASERGMRALCVTAPEMVDRQEQVGYFLRLGAPDSAQLRDAEQRIRVVSVDDASARWLSTKVMDDNEEAAELRRTLAEWVADRRARGQTPVLSAFEPSPNLEALAADLGIAIDQAPSSAIPFGSKAGSRKMFTAQGVPAARGTAEQRSADDLARAMVPLFRQGIRDFVVKLSSSLFASGLGNALLSLEPMADVTTASDDELTAVLRASLPSARVSAVLGGWDGFAAAIPQAGVVAEELLVGDELTSPSFQGCLTASGPRVLATHEQVLAGGQTYSGSSFPAAETYRRTVIDHGLRVGWGLHKRGLHTGNYGVDFVAVRSGTDWTLYGCEVNLRSTGVMHGFALVTTLLGVEPDENGELRVDGEPRVYLASDTLTAPGYEGLRPRDVIDTVSGSGLHYNSATRSGVVMYMLSALAYGKLGALAVARDLAGCDRMIQELRGVLDGLAADREVFTADRALAARPGR